jgi:hypothetical protein
MLQKFHNHEHMASPSISTTWDVLRFEILKSPSRRAFKIKWICLFSSIAVCAVLRETTAVDDDFGNVGVVYILLLCAQFCSITLNVCWNIMIPQDLGRRHSSNKREATVLYNTIYKWSMVPLGPIGKCRTVEWSTATFTTRL